MRLETLSRTRDGFEIAEADLKLRGPGEFLGKDQSGLPPFRFADLAADLDLVELARNLARKSIREAKPTGPSCRGNTPPG